MHFVCADLGASSTRYTSNTGKIEVMPNNMVFIGDDTRVDQEPYSSDIESALDVVIESDNKCEYFPARVLVGQMAERYSSINERPTVLKNKHVQRVNYISAVLSVALSKHKHNLEENVGLYIALPPGEVKVAKDVLKENLVGNYVVTCKKLNNMKVKFKIEDVNTYEESFMAMLAYFFEMTGTVREQAKQYARGTVLSMDIGASTTDLAVIQNMKYLERSGQTFRTGGNIARDILVDRIREQYGFDAPVEMAELAMAEGRIQFGRGYQDCSNDVEAAKRTFAAQIVDQMQGYFRKINIPINGIMAIVVSGGGSMQGQYVNNDGKVIVTSKPMSYYITEELNKVCPGVAVEHFSDNPRLANITGLFIRANVDIKRKEKAITDTLSK